MKKLATKWFYKNLVYYPVVLLRGEWIWSPLKQLKDSQFLDRGEIEKIQLSRLNHILETAQTSSYYRDLSLPGKLDKLDQLAYLPLLEKEDLREHAHQIETSIKHRQYTVKTSGGSTGAPVTLKKPARAMGKELAGAWRGYSWAGIGIGEMQARFWGVPMTDKMKNRARLIDLVTRRIRFSAFKFNASDLDEYLNILVKKKPDYFYGYASMLYELAQHVISTNRIGIVTPKAIITTSEVLTDTIRQSLQEAFLCKVYNEYGCGEVGTIAHECEYGRMHINMENVYIEIVDEEGHRLPNGVMGEIVATDLNNDLMPLIRYRLRDFGSLSNESCQCGRNLQILENIKGRAYDFLTNEKGQKFHGEFFLYIIEELKQRGVIIKAIQFIGSNEGLRILIASSEIDYELATNYIELKLRKFFSQTIPLLFSRVSSVEREKSGKLRVIKSEY